MKYSILFVNLLALTLAACSGGSAVSAPGKVETQVSEKKEEVFNGVDFGVDFRMGNGGLLAGGITVGRTLVDTCWQNDLPAVGQIGTSKPSTSGSTATRRSA